MKRAKSVCTYAGCGNVINSGEYRCYLHPYESMRKTLDKKKTPESRKFYSGSKWTKTSLAHRKREPLCRKCKEKGLVVEGVLVDHNPDRLVLIKKGLDPYDHKYLQTLCYNCHQSKLRYKKESSDSNDTFDLSQYCD